MRNHCDPDHDRDLVAALRRGDGGAFEEAYDRYRGRVLRFLAGLTGRRGDAEDLLQDTFFRLARHAPRLREDTDLAAWLFTVARNLFRSQRRWQLLDLSRIVVLAADAAAIRAPATPADDAERAEDLERVQRALRRLPVGSREAVLLVAVEGLDPQRAAEVTGVSHAAFRQRLARARAELTRSLERSDRREPPGQPEEKRHARTI